MLRQQTPDFEIKQIADCPVCKRPTMTLMAIDPGVFLGGVFTRYSCRSCSKTIELSFPPPTV